MEQTLAGDGGGGNHVPFRQAAAVLQAYAGDEQLTVKVFANKASAYGQTPSLANSPDQETLTIQTSNLVCI